jgi:hypothetical protein
MRKWRGEPSLTHNPFVFIYIYIYIYRMRNWHGEPFLTHIVTRNFFDSFGRVVKVSMLMRARANLQLLNLYVCESVRERAREG